MIMGGWSDLTKATQDRDRKEVLVELLLTEVQRLRGIIDRVLDGELVRSPVERALVPKVRTPEFVDQSENRTAE